MLFTVHLFPLHFYSFTYLIHIFTSQSFYHLFIFLLFIHIFLLSFIYYLFILFPLSLCFDQSSLLHLIISSSHLFISYSIIIPSSILHIRPSSASNHSYAQFTHYLFKILPSDSRHSSTASITALGSNPHAQSSTSATCCTCHTC